MTRVEHRSQSVEHYTPAHIVEAARRAMGGIQLDPASCALANRVVRADEIYTIADDGLSKDWRGREGVWLNPPYGRGVTRKWVEKFFHEVDEGCLLVPASTASSWFDIIWEGSCSICFLHRRLRFYTPEGAPKAVAPTGHVVALVNVDNSQQHFGGWGKIVWP